MNPLGDSNKVKALIASMEAVCEAKGRTRVNGATASERTFRMQKEVMRQFARTLHEAGFLIEVAANLGEKHINAVFDHWVLVKDLSNKTLQNQKSRVKQFCLWMGKPQLAAYVAQIDDRYKEKLPQGFRTVNVATESKSWRGAGLDIQEIYRLAMEQDARFGAMIMLERAFGLRKKEVLLTNPWKAAKSGYLEVRENIGKGGRPRQVPIRGGEYGESQRRVLEFAKRYCKRWDTMAWPDLTFKQAERRYYYLCERIGLTKEQGGMTGHGLRAGFAEDMMLLDGMLPPVLGGTKEMSPKAERNVSNLSTSRAMGHNRLNIVKAYYGSEERFAKAGSLLGHRFGDPLVLSKDSQALLWVSEKPVAVEGEPGLFHLPGESLELAYITVQIVQDEKEIARLSVGQFLAEHPLGLDALEVRMGLLGLTMVKPEDVAVEDA